MPLVLYPKHQGCSRVPVPVMVMGLQEPPLCLTLPVARLPLSHLVISRDAEVINPDCFDVGGLREVTGA